MSNVEKKPKVRTVKENLWRIIAKETDRLEQLIQEQKKHKQVA